MISGNENDIAALLESTIKIAENAGKDFQLLKEEHDTPQMEEIANSFNEVNGLIKKASKAAADYAKTANKKR